MIVVSWILPVGNRPSFSFEKNREEIWRKLLAKAEDPIGYVPAITDCEILERHVDGFTRRIRRDGRFITQRVTFDQERWRIVFRHVKDPEVAAIINELNRDENGLLTLAMAIELAPGMADSLTAESRFLRDSDSYFTRTLAAAAEVLNTS